MSYTKVGDLRNGYYTGELSELLLRRGMTTPLALRPTFDPESKINTWTFEVRGVRVRFIVTPDRHHYAEVGGRQYAMANCYGAYSAGQVFDIILAATKEVSA